MGRATPRIASDDRSMVSTRGGVPTGWAVAMVTFSANPHAGVIAPGAKPYAVKRAVKAAIVEARTGSAALMAMRQLDRSSPVTSPSATRLAQIV